MSHIIQFTKVRALVVVTLLAVYALLLIFHRQTAAQTVTEHPYIAQEELKTETCLGCHPDKKEGKFVHTAVTSGCESCHQATSEKEKEKTTITLMAQGGELCAMCHEAQKDVVVHKPYQLGQCLVCHDAHAGSFKAQLRAATNMVCLSCHGMNQKDVKVSREAQTVSVLGAHTVPFDEYNQAPKIGLDPTGRFGHPWSTHPVAERPDPLRDGEKMSCLSCHAHHCSPAAKRIRVAKGQPDVCETCHQAIQEQKEAAFKKKMEEEQAKAEAQQAQHPKKQPEVSGVPRKAPENKL